MAHDPEDIHRDLSPEDVPSDAPPLAANYREADIDGISCASCARYEFSDESGGICDLWEAKVAADHVCSSYTEDTPPMDDKGEYQWDFADSEPALAEIHLAGAGAREEEGFILKEILRTGEWNVTPTSGGTAKKPLKIVRDGKSDIKDGVISMADIVENFKAGAIPNVQIPLSDDNQDHKNITRLNTGYVRDVWITDEDNGSKLVAKMEFTEPEVKEKVLRGTYADVSCGIPWAVKSRGKNFGASLEHVAITNRPFVDGLGPFIAASDTPAEDVEVTHFSIEEKTETEEEKPEPISFADLVDAGNKALQEQLALGSTYTVNNVVLGSSGGGGNASYASAGTFYVTDSTSKTSWTVPYQNTGTGNGNITLTGFDTWTVVDEGEEDAPVDKTTAPRQPSFTDGLEAAQSLRQIRLSKPAITKKEADNMPTLTREELERLDLSDEQRAAFQDILDQNVELSAKAREASAEERISELKEMGFDEKPGFLKFYREVMLSDDGGPAVVLLSDGEQKENLTALEILNRAIDSLATDGKVILSDQALVSGNDDPPPADASEEVPLEDRVVGVKKALGLKVKEGAN